jgi:hypothetical protein
MSVAPEDQTAIIASIPGVNWWPVAQDCLFACLFVCCYALAYFILFYFFLFHGIYSLWCKDGRIGLEELSFALLFLFVSFVCLFVCFFFFFEL